MTETNFETDPYPGRPKILFVANSISSHTIDWIHLLDGAQYNVRLFSTPDLVAPPDDFPVRTYISGLGHGANVPESDIRKRRHPMNPPVPSLLTRVIWRLRRQVGFPVVQPDRSMERWLIDIIETWQPDLIQSLSLTSSAALYDACQKYDYHLATPWILMIWGAPDILTQQHHPEESQRLKQILGAADYVFSDTEECMEAARGLGVTESQIPEYYLFPGAGGIDIDAAAALWQNHPPSKRRILLWPKSYHNYYTSGLSTLEAIKLAWDRIQPCELVIPNMKAAVEHWYWALPDHIREHTRIPAHMPHAEFQQLMAQSRVMLAPSLLDGMPNVLVDAMACGAFPIVSPLGGLTPVLTDEHNTLFARNLYPNEIAEAIVRAMTDDALVDAAARRNLDAVRTFAERAEIRRQVLHIYEAAIHVDKSQA